MQAQVNIHLQTNMLTTRTGSAHLEAAGQDLRNTSTVNLQSVHLHRNLEQAVLNTYCREYRRNPIRLSTGRFTFAFTNYIKVSRNFLLLQF